MESLLGLGFFPPFSCPLGKLLVQSWKCLGFSFTASCCHEIIPAFCGTFLNYCCCPDVVFQVWASIFLLIAGFRVRMSSSVSVVLLLSRCSLLALKFNQKFSSLLLVLWLGWACQHQFFVTVQIQSFSFEL